MHGISNWIEMKMLYYDDHALSYSIMQNQYMQQENTQDKHKKNIKRYGGEWWKGGRKATG